MTLPQNLTEQEQTQIQDALKNTLCLGIAGNFAGHLEQAGETPDFITVKTESKTAPKGIFPYFAPNLTGQIGKYPISSTQIRYPQGLSEDAHLQAEPEICVVFDAHYEFGKVTSLTPKAFAAFNDCSIRKPGAKKISEKKNWGAESKGIAKNFLPLNTMEKGGTLDSFYIVSFLKRDHSWHLYGNDSAVNSYSYFHKTLMDWMIDKLNHQADFGPLENLNQLLHQTGFPKQIMVSLGATTYTEFGERTILQPGDEIAVYAYDRQQISPEMIQQELEGDIELPVGVCSILKQTII